MIRSLIVVIFCYGVVAGAVQRNGPYILWLALAGAICGVAIALGKRKGGPPRQG